MSEPRATEPRPLERLHDAYYAIPAGEPTVEQVMEALPALYDAVQGVLDGAARIGGLLAVVDSAERQGTTIHVATRATCRDHLADPNGYTSAHPARPTPQPLDVERLIKALQSHPDHLTWTTIIRLQSDWLQTAYARLGSQEGSE